ncbi:MULTISPECIES: hypothetical protein [Sorangium]|uniref:Uncharacterized protein n=1 Tax=Sorangium cellulosum (strain So ce56) TaxID=448385 RepID=A9ES72_SORC5|nr:hypothetical protein [Sorangium cellulosum]CAN97361.1 hypothetical protein predicted by Glimmer/Critica [Sorangium cellulosum So ce56]
MTTAMQMPMMPQTMYPMMPTPEMAAGAAMMPGMMGMGMPMMGMMPGMMGMPMMPTMGMMPGMMGMSMPMMPGMMGMGMPMMGMMPGMMGMGMPMMCKMSCEMTKDGMVCKMMPPEGMSMDVLKERCEAMTKMMSAGMPMMMMCGGMPMMMCTPATTK